MGKMQRRKGHNYEREKAKQLTDLGFPTKRLLEYQEGFGVDLLPKGLKLKIQCKVGANPPWYGAVLEAASYEDDSRFPVAFVKKDRVGEFVVMRFEDFMKKIYMFS